MHKHSFHQIKAKPQNHCCSGPSISPETDKSHITTALLAPSQECSIDRVHTDGRLDKGKGRKDNHKPLGRTSEAKTDEEDDAPRRRRTTRCLGGSASGTERETARSNRKDSKSEN